MDPTSKLRMPVTPSVVSDRAGKPPEPALGRTSLAGAQQSSTQHVKDQLPGGAMKRIDADVTNTKAGAAFVAATGTTTGAKPTVDTAAAAPKKPPPTSKIKYGAAERDQYFQKLSPEARKLAKKHQLTKDEAAAVVAYTGNAYYADINNHFRSLPLANVDISNAAALKKAGVGNADLADLIAALVRGLRKLPPAQTDESVFMCLGRNVTLPNDELDEFLENNEVTISAFLSTTVSSELMVTDSWWNKKDHAMFIYQRLNGNGRDISAFSLISTEKEILFLPNTKFQVMFRSEPVETPAGIRFPEDYAAESDPQGNKVTKTLIAIQEVPDATQTQASSAASSSKAQQAGERKSGAKNAETTAKYFGLR